jgi:MFS transporter, DHA1 family, inner membrane transport protein
MEDLPAARRFAPTALMLGNFVTACCVLAPVGMLGELSSGLDVTISTAGLLITFGAVVLCIGSPATAWLDATGAAGRCRAAALAMVMQTRPSRTNSVA